jgi:hypothetical protein
MGKRTRRKDNETLRHYYYATAFELLRKTPTDGILTLDVAGDAMGLNPVDDRAAIQSAIRRAGQLLVTEDRRAIEAVENVGYRVTRADERVRLSRRIRDGISRRAQQGRTLVINVDMGALNPEQRHEIGVERRYYDHLDEIERRGLNRETERAQAAALMFPDGEIVADAVREVIHRIRREQPELPEA